MSDNDQQTEKEIRLNKYEYRQLKSTVQEMEKKVEKMHETLFEEREINNRTGIDDIRLMRQIYVRFKSARFIFGAVAGILTFLATAGWAIYKITELILTFFKTKGG